MAFGLFLLFQLSNYRTFVIFCVNQKSFSVFVPYLSIPDAAPQMDTCQI